MKKNVFSILLTIFLWTGCSARPPVTHEPTPMSPENRPTVAVLPTSDNYLQSPTLFPARWEDRDDFRSGLAPSGQSVLGELPGASVVHLDIVIADDLTRISATEEIFYTNREAGALSDVVLRLFPNLFNVTMTIQDVRVNDVPVIPVMESADSTARILLQKPLAVGESLIISLSYTLQFTPGNGDGLAFVVDPQRLLALAQAYPMIPVYDEEYGWYEDIPSPSGDLTYNDAAFYRVRVTMPSEWLVYTSGSELSRRGDGDHQILEFRSGPARDFYLGACLGCQVQTRNLAGVNVNLYIFPEDEAGSELAFRTTENAITAFNQRFSPYPYTEFDIGSMPTGVLGIEYPGLTMIRSQLFDPAKVVTGAAAPVVFESTLAHEIGHQWFYNLVGNDQIHHPWLDESVTQYVTGLYYQDVYGQQAAAGYQSSWYARWDRVNRVKKSILLPVAAYDAENSYSPIVYGYGPIFLQEEASRFGEAVFNDFLKLYVQRYSWQVAAPPDFEQALEQTCGCDVPMDSW